MKRTSIALTAVLTSSLIALGACSTEDGSEPEGGEGSGESAETEAQGGSGDGAYPVTVGTAFGDVTIEEEPTRVVALGWGDAETALALDVQPVGASDWLGFGGEGVGPWAEGMYDEAPEIIETLEPSYEAIAALQPDLILDVKSSGEQERYDRLSEIATTVGIPEGAENYLTSSDEQVEMIAAALGRSDQGEELLGEVDEAFAEAAEAHPDWEGQSVAAATRTSEGWGAYIQGSERVDFLEQLGFVQSEQIAGLETDETGFSVSISEERLDLLDADVIVAFPIFIETTEITEDPLWQEVPAVADGRAVVIDGDLSDAYSLGTTMAQQYAIDELVPMLEEATQ